MRAKQFCVLTRTEPRSMVLLLIYCFMYLHLLVGGSVLVFVLLFITFQFCNHLDKEGRAGCFALLPFRCLVTVNVFGSSSWCRG